MIGDLRRVLSNIRVEDGREAFATLFVNPASAFVFVVANLLLHRAGSSFAALVNPWELTLGLWLAGWLAVRLALLGFVDGAVWVLGPRLPALPSRVGPKPIFQHTINALDCTYLAINSTIEYVFALQIGRLLWHSDLVALAPAALGVGNGPVALGLLFYVDDMLYAPLHRFMHHHKVYKWVHKHHHRNTFPSRGYVDAANEHPVEQIAALALHWTALHVVAKTSGLHVDRASTWNRPPRAESGLQMVPEITPRSASLAPADAPAEQRRAYALNVQQPACSYSDNYRGDGGAAPRADGGIGATPYSENYGAGAGDAPAPPPRGCDAPPMPPPRRGSSTAAIPSRPLYRC